MVSGCSRRGLECEGPEKIGPELGMILLDRMAEMALGAGEQYKQSEKSAYLL